MILLPVINSLDLYSILRFHALCAFISISTGLSFKRHQQTGHFPSKSDSGALSSTALESHMRSARNASLMITSQDRQNTPLHRKFQSGRAIFKALESPTRSPGNGHLVITSQDRQNSLLLHEIQNVRAIFNSLRISYTQSRQWTSTHYVTLLKTDHFSSKSRMCALSSIVLESHGLRHLLITPKHSKTLHSSSKLKPGALSSNALESPTQRPSHLPPMIPSEEGQYTPLRRNIELECALLKTP